MRCQRSRIHLLDLLRSSLLESGVIYTSSIFIEGISFDAYVPPPSRLLLHADRM